MRYRRCREETFVAAELAIASLHVVGLSRSAIHSNVISLDLYVSFLFILGATPSLHNLVWRV